MSKYAKLLILLTLLVFVSVFAMAEEKKSGAYTCPVTGETVKKADAKISYEYKGTTFYFCCENCKEAFVKEPGKYVKKVFTCSMCPGVESDQHGKCPKCGLDLKAKLVATPVAKDGAHKECCEEKAKSEKKEAPADKNQEKKAEDCGGCPHAAKCLDSKPKKEKK